MDDMDMLRQVRKALNDIDITIAELTIKTRAPYNESHAINRLAHKADYQLILLRKMIDSDNPQPWSHYQPQVEEEFDA